MNELPSKTSAANQVQLTGKVSRWQGLRYTPSGAPICEFLLAVNQESFEKKSVGYFEVQVSGTMAEELQGKVKVGKKVSVQGALWMRNYKNKNGVVVTEVKVVAEDVTPS